MNRLAFNLDDVVVWNLAVYFKRNRTPVEALFECHGYSFDNGLGNLIDADVWLLLLLLLWLVLLRSHRTSIIE